MCVAEPVVAQGTSLSMIRAARTLTCVLTSHRLQGYGRLGAALHGLRRYEEAATAYDRGLALEPTNQQLQHGRAECQKAQETTATSAMASVAQAFAAPDLLAQIASNPALAGFLLQEDFKEKLAQIQANPASLNEHLQDQRILQVLLMLMQKGGQFPKEPFAVRRHVALGARKGRGACATTF